MTYIGQAVAIQKTLSSVNADILRAVQDLIESDVGLTPRQYELLSMARTHTLSAGEQLHTVAAELLDGNKTEGQGI